MGDRNIDSGHAWLVLVCSCLLMVISGLVTYSTGVITTAVLEEMGEGVAKTSWIGSTLIGTAFLTGPVASSVTNLHGCRASAFIGGLLMMFGMIGASFAVTVDYLIAFYGVVTGVGLGLVENSSMVCVGHYFEKYRPLAAGIHSSGTGWGMLAGVPLVRFLLDRFGLRGTFLLMGAVAANSCVFGMFIRPIQIQTKDVKQMPSDCPKEMVEDMQAKAKQKSAEQTGKVTLFAVQKIQHDLNQKEQTSFTDCSKKMVKNMQEVQKQKSREATCKDNLLTMLQRIKNCPDQVFVILPFSVFLAAQCLIGFQQSAFIVHLPNYVESKGTSPQNSAMLFTAIGISSMTSRVVIGLAANIESIGPFRLYTFCTGMLGISILAFPYLSSTFTHQMVFSSMVGLFNSGPIALCIPVSAALAGVKRLGLAIGMIYLFCGVGLLAGPPVSGFLIEITGNYDICFYGSGTSAAISCLLSVALVVLKRRKGDGSQDCQNMDII